MFENYSLNTLTGENGRLSILYFLLAQIFEIESSIPKSVDAHLNKNEIYGSFFQEFKDY